MASRRRKTRKSRKSRRSTTRRSRRSSRSRKSATISSAWKKRHPRARWACKKGGGFKGFAKKKNAKRVCAHPRKVR